jgi:hypothetical protein
MLTGAGLIGVGAFGTYVTGSLQFRRQQRAERVRWLEDRRYEAYTDALSKLRSWNELQVVQVEFEYGAPRALGLVRDGSGPPDEILSRLRLVGSEEVRRATDLIGRWIWNAEVNGDFDSEDVGRLADHMQELEAAMRRDLDAVQS